MNINKNKRERERERGRERLIGDIYQAVEHPKANNIQNTIKIQ